MNEQAPAPPGLPDGVRLDHPQDLGGSQRSSVTRYAVLRAPAHWGGSVVVKHFVPQPPGEGSGWGYLREQVGLAHLPGAPRLLCSDDASQTLVMEDLGTHPTLADVLLGEDADEAVRHTLAWAGTLGRTVRSDAEVLAQARRQLDRVLHNDRELMCRYPEAGLTRLQQVTGNRHTAAATAEILGVAEELDRDTGKHVLSPGDTCPDNAMVTPGGIRFLDLEGAGVRHLALEGAYALEPFSTCWCVFQPPEGLTRSLFAAFTTGAEAHLPGLSDDPHWPRQVRGAVALWVCSANSWLLDGALGDRVLVGGGPPGTEPRGPSFRALLVARWRWVLRHCADELPDTAAACDEAITWAVRRWGDGRSLELPPYPAFGGASVPN